MKLKTIGIIIACSQRKASIGDTVAKWFIQVANLNSIQGYKFEIVDLNQHKLPVMDDPIPPMVSNGVYSSPSVTKFSEAIKSKDGFIFIIPENYHSYSGNLKNAVDHLFYEWKGKPTIISMYGYLGGSTAIANDQLAHVLSKSFLQMPIAKTRPCLTIDWSMVDEDGKFKDITRDFKQFEQVAIDSVKDLQQLFEEI